MPNSYSMWHVAQPGKILWEKKTGASANIGEKGDRFIRFYFHKLLRRLASTGLSLKQSAHTIKKSHMTCLLIQTWAREIHREQRDLPWATAVKPHAFYCHDSTVFAHRWDSLFIQWVFFLSSYELETRVFRHT